MMKCLIWRINGIQTRKNVTSPDSRMAQNKLLKSIKIDPKKMHVDYSKIREKYSKKFLSKEKKEMFQQNTWNRNLRENIRSSSNESTRSKYANPSKIAFHHQQQASHLEMNRKLIRDVTKTMRMKIDTRNYKHSLLSPSSYQFIGVPSKTNELKNRRTSSLHEIHYSNSPLTDPTMTALSKRKASLLEDRYRKTDTTAHTNAAKRVGYQRSKKRTLTQT